MTAAEALVTNTQGDEKMMGKDGSMMGEIEHKPGSYSQFLHLFHAHRHTARFLGGHISATGQVEHTHAGIRERLGEAEEE